MSRKRTQAIIFTSILSICAIILIVVFVMNMPKFTYKTYSSGFRGFSIKYPANWYVDDSGGINVMFMSPLEGDLDVYRESVNVLIEDLPQKYMDLDYFTSRAMNQMKAVFKANMEVFSQETVTLNGKQAHRLNYLIRMPEASIRYLSVWTVTNRKSYQIFYTASESQYEKYLPKAEKMIKSFKFLY